MFTVNEFLDTFDCETDLYKMLFYKVRESKTETCFEGTFINPIELENKGEYEIKGLHLITTEQGKLIFLFDI